MAWTKEQALTEIDRLITKIVSLQSGNAFDAEHVRWRSAAVAVLEEVFGQDSGHLLSFAHLTWRPQGSYIVSAFEIEEEVARQNRLAYLNQLDTAKGILLAARDELERKGLSEVYHGKNTGPEASIILKVIGLAEHKLRKVIRNPPTAERDIQDAFESLLVGADVPYSKEADRIEFSSKTYTPDFCARKSDLAIELKLCNRKEREKEIIAEINDDIAAYKKKYGNLLFVIYDTGFIRDIDRFSENFEDQEGVVVRIVKH